MSTSSCVRLLGGHVLITVAIIRNMLQYGVSVDGNCITTLLGVIFYSNETPIQPIETQAGCTDKHHHSVSLPVQPEKLQHNANELSALHC